MPIKSTVEPVIIPDILANGLVDPQGALGASSHCGLSGNAEVRSQVWIGSGIVPQGRLVAAIVDGHDLFRMQSDQEEQPLGCALRSIVTGERFELGDGLQPMLALHASRPKSVCASSVGNIRRRWRCRWRAITISRTAGHHQKGDPARNG